MNPGLVAIIGARGSGKTALADVIALGCDATRGQLTESSFLECAKPLLGNASATLTWEEGESVPRRLDLTDVACAADYPRAKYLSQKFVETLCSAHEVTDSLLEEIERVIFEAHPAVDQDGAATFRELLDVRAARFREARSREEESLAQLSARLGAEIQKEKRLPGLKKQLAEKTKLIDGYLRDRKKLVAKGGEERMERLTVLTEAADTLREHLAVLTRREQSLLSLQDTVANFRERRAPEALRTLKEEHNAAGLTESQWASFALDYTGDVNSQLEKKLGIVRRRIELWKGTVPDAEAGNDDSPSIPKGANLKRQRLAQLDAEIARLQRLVSADRDTANKFTALSSRIRQETTARDRLKEQVEDSEGAGERKRALQENRKAAYLRVFETILSEEQVLRDLYDPLSIRLAGGSETLKRLVFSVKRESNVTDWAESGEKLLDRRVEGPFKGIGTLKKRADESLKQAWEKGNAEEASAAMSEFIENNRSALVDHSTVSPTHQGKFQTGAVTLAKWLYSTDHITIRYSIEDDGVDIRNLSPGTRGIVMVLLYLALDDADDRPLIIDQPEENLDPKSIYDELVGLFQEAKNRRQIILVTHNANLVVNAGADQIIVASAGPHAHGGLPPISYVSGGLEAKSIRDDVCNILEGGETALQERARRLRVALDR